MSKPGVVEKKQVKGGSGRILLLSFLVTFVILALCVIKGAMLFNEALSLQKKIMEFKGDIANSKKMYTINEMEREWSEYVDKIGQVTQLAGIRSAWGDKLGILSESVPAGLAFEFVSFAAASNVMILEAMVPPGEEQGYGLAKNYVDELKTTKQFGENIKINYAERNERGLEVIQIMVKFS